MSFNLIDTIKQNLSSELIAKAASHLGENESNLQSAFSTAIPSVLSSLLHKSENAESSHGILNMAKDAANSGVLSNLSGLVSGASSGAGILGFANSIFGDKLSGITKLIASFSGIKESSASTILSMAAPTVLASLGKHTSDNNLDASGLASFLSNQKDSIISAIPSGFNLSSILNLGGFAGMPTSISSATNSVVNTTSNKVAAAATTISNFSNEKVGSATTATANFANKTVEETKGGINKLLLPLLAFALIAGLAWFLLKGCKDKVTDTTIVSDTSITHTSTVDTTVKTVSEVIVSSIKVSLPGGVSIDANKGGIEDKLVSFLSSDYKSLGADSLKKIWFNFDNLNFKTGSAQLTPESMKQVENMVAILKAFPAVNVKIGGYTDKTGNEDSNVKLSSDRATTVKTELDKAGVSKQVIAAEGYGSKFAMYAADAPEKDRVNDRHVSLNVKP